MHLHPKGYISSTFDTGQRLKLRVSGSLRQPGLIPVDFMQVKPWWLWSHNESLGNNSNIV